MNRTDRTDREGQADDHECHCGGACCTEKPAGRSPTKNGKPDFEAMTSAQRVAYLRERLNRRFG